jgi:hypothetical protein
VVGSTMEAPRTGLQVIWEPSVVNMKSDGRHAGWKCCNGVWFKCVGGGYGRVGGSVCVSVV